MFNISFWTAPPSLMTSAKELSGTGFKLANRELSNTETVRQNSCVSGKLLVVELNASICLRPGIVALCCCQVCRKFAESAAVAHDWARRWPRPIRNLAQ